MSTAGAQITRFIAASLSGAALAAAVVGVGTVSAQAATRYPNAHALMSLGLQVKWPVDRAAITTVKPGAKLVVRVSRVAGAEPPVTTVSFSRVSATGAQLQELSSAKLRHGAFVAKVPHAAGGRYRLALRAGKLHYESLVATAPAPASAEEGTGATATSSTTTSTTIAATVPPPASSGSPVNSQPPPQMIPNPCPATGTYSATLTLASPTVVQGQDDPYTVQNTGSGCLAGGEGYILQELVNGVPTQMPDATLNGNPIAFTMEGILLQPGGSFKSGVLAPTNYPPGAYQMTATWDGSTGWGGGLGAPVMMTAILQIVAPSS